MSFSNVYEDPRRAESYDKLEFPGTYWLAFRDLPRIIGERTAAGRAIDFGCGTGRSTRFLRGLGFEVTGVDISSDMIARARGRDPQGDYRLIADGDLGALEDGTFALVLSAFTFDNVPTMDHKVGLLAALASKLAPGGAIVNVVSSPEIYTHEWASFTTRDFPENRAAKSGDKVKIVMTDVEDRRPVEDILWTPEDWREAYRRAGLELVASHKPLARGDEPVAWVNETHVAPWTIDVLGRAGR